jgi:hypothetical protein
LIQVWPLTLIAFYGRSNDVSESIRRITKLWGLASTLTALLYQTEITDIDAWCHSISKASLDLIELWSIQWELDDLKNKTKFHHLTHLSMWAKRFGPTIVGSAEINEAANKRIRRHLSLSNRQAGSRDLANKLATAQGIQFLVQEGIWKVNKDAVTMTRPGSALRELCRVLEVWDLVGLPTPRSSSNTADVLFPIRRNNVVQKLQGHLIKRTFGLNCVEQSEYFLFSRFRLVDSRFSLGKVSSFVSIGETVLRIACILRESKSGISFLIAEVFERMSVPEGSLEEQVKRYQTRKQYKWLQPNTVQTLLSVQHVCCAGCRVQENCRNAFRREGEWISGNKWMHAESNEWMINPYILKVTSMDEMSGGNIEDVLENEVEHYN